MSHSVPSYLSLSTNLSLLNPLLWEFNVVCVFYKCALSNVCKAVTEYGTIIRVQMIQGTRQRAHGKTLSPLASKSQGKLRGKGEERSTLLQIFHKSLVVAHCWLP